MSSGSTTATRQGGWQRRMLLAAVVIAITQGGLFAASLLLFPSHVRAARAPLVALSRTIDGWEGVDTEPDDRVVGSLQCDDILGRIYTGPGGQQVVLHIAAWRDAGEWTPHPPERCYTNNGWRLLGRRRPNFWGEAGRQAETQTYFRDGQQVLLTYWYQIGDVAYYNRDGGRPARMQYLGQQVRPPLFKVMLQIPDLGEETDFDGVKQLALTIEEFLAQQ